jgi:hypothetical protein
MWSACLAFQNRNVEQVEFQNDERSHDLAAAPYQELKSLFEENHDADLLLAVEAFLHHSEADDLVALPAAGAKSPTNCWAEQ